MGDDSDESLHGKRKRSDSDYTSSSGSGDSSVRSKVKSHKKKSSEHKKKKKLEKRKGKKKKKDKDHEKRHKSKKSKKHKSKKLKYDPGENIGPVLPSNLPVDEEQKPQRNFAPMSKDQWEAKQKDIRRVLDEETGRYRLIRGDGEIVEEIVSRDRHREINKQATLGDGAYFQSVLSNNKTA